MKSNHLHCPHPPPPPPHFCPFPTSSSYYNIEHTRETMSSFMRKNLYLCFSKIKCLPPPHDLEADDRLSPSSTSTSVLHDTPSPAATDDPLSPSSSSSYSFDDPDFLSTLPDLATIYASRRFFFSSPGLSNSIVESCSEDAGAATALFPMAGGVAVRKYSPDPRGDFRRSMEEMMEAKEAKDVKQDWEYLHELLLCYLRLNPKHTHKYIIDAFTDLIISLMSKSQLEKGDIDIDLSGCQTKRGVNSVIAL